MKSLKEKKNNPNIKKFTLPHKDLIFFILPFSLMINRNSWILIDKNQKNKYNSTHKSENVNVFKNIYLRNRSRNFDSQKRLNARYSKLNIEEEMMTIHIFR